MGSLQNIVGPLGPNKFCWDIGPYQILIGLWALTKLFWPLGPIKFVGTLGPYDILSGRRAPIKFRGAPVNLNSMKIENTI